MSTLKTNQLTHLSNSGTANVIFEANGSARVNNDLTVDDALNVTGNTNLTGTAALASTLTVTGNTTLNGATNTIAGQVNMTGSNVSISGADHIDMSTGGTAYTIKTNGKGARTVSTSAPSGSGHADGDIWYQVS